MTYPSRLFTKRASQRHPSASGNGCSVAAPPGAPCGGVWRGGGGGRREAGGHTDCSIALYGEHASRSSFIKVKQDQMGFRTPAEPQRCACKSVRSSQGQEGGSLGGVGAREGGRGGASSTLPRSLSSVVCHLCMSSIFVSRKPPFTLPRVEPRFSITLSILR